jgi:D-alanyl-D-alanine-carboxypeptidase/D-alanyl-D-alanine-endopeptidase
MRIVLLIAMACVGALSGADPKAIIDKEVEGILKDRPYAAVVVGVVREGKDHVYTFGKCEGKPLNGESIFEIGSVTKVFTGLLLADRIVAGAMKVDDPVQKYLPEGWSVPRRDDRDITLLHLATHTSGLTRLPAGFFPIMSDHPDEPYAYFKLEDLRKGLPKTNVRWSSGAKHEYSNLGVGLLGQAITFSLKEPNYEAALTKQVLAPLKLNDTTLKLNQSQKSRLIPGFDGEGRAKQNWDFGSMEGGGALRSDANDMLRFIHSQLNPPTSLKKAIEISHQNWRELNPGKEEIGLCWFRRMSQDKVILWHNGETGGYHTFLGVVPGVGGIIVLCNVATDKVDSVGFKALNAMISQEKK